MLIERRGVISPMRASAQNGRHIPRTFSDPQVNEEVDK
jgi:hypothetical protein